MKKIIYAFMANSTSKFCLLLWRRNTSGNVLRLANSKTLFSKGYASAERGRKKLL